MKKSPVVETAFHYGASKMKNDSLKFKIIFLAIFFGGVFILPKISWAAVYEICSSGCDFSTIQAAFANDLNPDDIIEVQADTPGGSKTYYETITPQSNDSGSAGHPVILKSRAGDNITIDGEDRRYYGVDLSSVSYFNVDGFRMDNMQYAAIFSRTATGREYVVSHNTINISTGGTATGARQAIIFSATATGGQGPVNAIIENNIVTMDTGSYPTDDTDGIKIPGTIGAVVRYNTITMTHNASEPNNHSDGIQAWDAWDTTIYGNTIHMVYNVNYNQGIYLEWYNRNSDAVPTDYGYAKVYNNVIYGYGGGILFQVNAKAGIFNEVAKVDLEAYNNTIDTFGGLPFVLRSVQSAVVKNNIFIARASSFTYGIYNDDGTHTTAIDADYNHIYPQIGTAQNDDVLEISGAAYPARNFMTWAEAKSAGYETHGIGYSNGWIDPSLQNYAPNFISDSDVDKGVALVEFSSDLNGISRPQYSAWDIGAYEYVGGAPADTTPPSAPGGLAVI